MTFPKRLPSLPGREMRRAVTRVLFLAAAALLVVTPSWRAARALAGLCAAATGGASPASDGRVASSSSAPGEEEEPAEAAALPRPDIEIGRAAARRDARVAWSGAARRRDIEHASAVAAHRWSSYRAPPRAPPPRLLN